MKKILIFCLFLPFLACGQVDKVTEESLKSRVKALDEFISRFNYEIDMKGEKVQNRIDMNARKKQLLQLWDFETTQKTTELEQKAISDFVNQVCSESKSMLISFKDMDWYAEAECQIKFKGKSEKIKVILRVETDTNLLARWSVYALKASFLEIKPKDSCTYLSPVSHELNFMELAEASNKKKENVINFAPIGYSPDQLSIFFWLIKSGDLQIEYVDKIKYHFLQIPNFIFTVEHFERAGHNVGWLISSLKSANGREKAMYRQNLGIR